MKMAGFKWTKKKNEVAILLSWGYTGKQVAKETKVGERTIYRWKSLPVFSAEVDRLSLQAGIAGKAKRLRIAKRIVREIGEESDRDLLDWLKYAQGETS